MKTNEINECESILKQLIDRAILDSVKLTFHMCRDKKNYPQEPDFVAALSLNFSKDLFNILRVLFPHYNLSVTGVYCHQKPLVDIGAIKKPEIGDILFVFRDRSYSADRFNSLLFQAKITNERIFTIRPEEHQLKLYKEWPEFTYHRAGKLNGQKRDILPKTINDGAQYLLIDNNPLSNGLCGVPGTFPIGCAVANNTLVLNNSLADEIFDFLKFKSGRAFERLHTGLKDDWSKMIWDLMTMSKSIASHRNNAGLKSFPRANEYVFHSTGGSKYNSLYFDLHSNDSYPNSKYYEGENEGQNEGVSIVLIESGQMQMEE